MLLQSAQRRTLGFMALLVASIFLAYLSFQVIQGWWASRPAVVESGLVNPLTLASLIFFILVPAISWSWSTPAAWVHEMEQNHKARQLALMQESELALAKASYSRALMIMERGLDNATMKQRQYVASVVLSLHQVRNEQLQQVAGHLQALTGVEASLMWRDENLIGQLDKVRDAIIDNQQQSITYYDAPDGIPREDLRAIAPPPRADGRDDSRGYVPDDSSHVRMASQSSIPREADDAPRTATHHDDALRIIRAELGTTVWTKKHIARVLKIEERTAQERIAGWRQAGAIEETGHLGRYKLTERA
jgi:hypothetical protein